MRKHLEQGYKLNIEQESYLIQRTIGEGASCIAYQGINAQSGDRCVVKEYYPIYYSLERTGNGALLCNADERDKYQQDKERFIESISRQLLLRQNDKIANQIFPIINRFCANNSYYTVAPLFSGTTYKSNKDIPLYDRIRICKSVINYVEKCHSLGYVCLDIKPDNIFIMPETPELAMFFDFDSVYCLDDIHNGMITSYTDEWAAPEQLIPGDCKRISFATDIFILGELIFWSVFDRHSSDEEHRRTSKYEFANSQYASLLTAKAKSLLIDIFHNSLRSSAKNRFQSIESLTELVNRFVVELMPKNESIISKYPSVSSFFVGRDDLISRINTSLEQKHLLFLCGIGGIGKSEIAKHYIDIYKDCYTNTIYLTYSFDLVTSVNQVAFISNFDQNEGETEYHYAMRKISKLSELLYGRTLLVIDNLDVELEVIEYKELWEAISALDCDILVTTRSKQETYLNNVQQIESIDHIDLVNLYYNYSPYMDDEREFVIRIIEAVQGHTLSIELIAKQANNAGKTPKEMYETLKERGILGLRENTVKWNLRNESVANHIKGLFALMEMSEEKKAIMFAMALVNSSGVGRNIFSLMFKDFCQADILALADNGWIGLNGLHNNTIYIHPVISEVIVDLIKDNEGIVNDIFERALEYLAYSLFFDAMGVEYDKNDHIVLCTGIANHIIKYGLENALAADYLIRYISAVSDYSIRNKKNSYISYAIKIYDSVFTKKSFVPAREYAYSEYVHYINDINHVEKVESICKEHLWEAKKNHETYLQLIWHSELFVNSTIKNSIKGYSPEQGLKSLLSLIILFYRIEIRMAFVDDYFTERKQKKRYYGDMTIHPVELSAAHYVLNCIESEEWGDPFYLMPPKRVNDRFQTALKLRESMEGIMTKNNPYVPPLSKLDKAQSEILHHKYEEAIDDVNCLLQYYDERGPHSCKGTYQAHMILGTLFFVTESYQESIREYQTCLQIAYEIEERETYELRIKLSRAYIAAAEYLRAETIDSLLIEELNNNDGIKRKLLLGEVYYNEALIKMHLCDNSDSTKAIDLFRYAIKQFEETDIMGQRPDIGIAKCKFQLGKIYSCIGVDTAIIFLGQAMDLFVKWAGVSHKETVMCKQLLDKCRSYSNK